MSAVTDSEGRPSVPTTPPSSELDVAQREVRHLMDTIAAMREQLERIQVDAQEQVQRSTADGHNEAVELRSTITAMREEMEAMRFDAERRVQAEVASAHGDMAQLQATIRALREQLEVQEHRRAADHAAGREPLVQRGGPNGR